MDRNTRTGWLGAPPQALEIPSCWELYEPSRDAGVTLAIGLAAISLVLNAAVIAVLIWRAC